MPAPRAKKQSLAPVRKVTAATLGAAVVAILNPIVHAIIPAYDPSPEIISAEVTIAAAVCGYVVPE